MNIIFFVTSITNCGPVNVVLNIIKEISKNSNISITLISLRQSSTNGNNDYSLVFQKEKIDNIVYLSDFSTPLKRLLFLNKIVKEADVIHSHGFLPDLYTSLLISNVLKVSTAHCIFLTDYQLTYGKLKGGLLSFFHHIIYLNTSFDNIIGCSNAVSDYLQKTNLFNKNKIFSIQNGVNTDTFFKLEHDEKLIKRKEFFIKYHIDQDISSNIYVYSGGLIRRKRVPELIEWFLKLSSDKNILLILGDGEEIDICKTMAKHAPNVLFLGFVNEVTPFYQLADYIVSNSSLEGFPMSILEGMACGCKALLSNITAHRELIQEFPNLATYLTKHFASQANLDTFKDDINYLSSERMSKEYLSICYKKTK